MDDVKYRFSIDMTSLKSRQTELAHHYLNYSVLDLNEAAYLLGYEDGNSFVRAFRTWEGVPPARWRENQRAKAASQQSPIHKEEG